MESAYIVTSWATRPPARREQRCPTPNQETDHVRDAAVFTADAPERRTAQPHRGAADASIFRGEGVSDRLASHGDQAEQILREGQADLIAVGREILNNPNWPMDAALKLGVEGPFRNVPPQFGYWLGARAKRGFGTRPSTWQNGLNETR